MIPKGDYKLERLGRDQIGLDSYIDIELAGPAYKLKRIIGGIEYVLGSWRMAGSEMVKFYLAENFMKLRTTVWAKAHLHLTSSIMESINNDIKVFFVIRDPRDIAADILKFDNGLHFRRHEFITKEYENNLEYLNENVEIQESLINWYRKNFGDNCLFLKYEDFIEDRNITLNKVSNFLELEPENVDSLGKYKSRFYKEINTRYKCFDQSILNTNYEMNLDFYKTWDYLK